MQRESSKAIYNGLSELNLSCGFNKTKEELVGIAKVLLRDLENESPRTIELAFDKIRRNAKWWPKVSEIIEACDSVRSVSDSSPSFYLPLGNSDSAPEVPAVPGTGWLVNKFLKEGRSTAEFEDAQKVIREEYRRHKDEGIQWPNTETSYIALMDFLFGTREPQNLGPLFKDGKVV